MPMMSRQISPLFVGFGCCSAIFWRNEKFSTWTESWFEGECIHVWAIGHIAHESRLKIQCPQEIGKKATAAYFSVAVYSPTYTVHHRESISQLVEQTLKKVKSTAGVDSIFRPFSQNSNSMNFFKEDFFWTPTAWTFFLFQNYELQWHELRFKN